MVTPRAADSQVPSAPASWVPRLPSDLSLVSRAADVLRGRRLLVLTGAGCSTESGIPDYRGPKQKERDAGSIQYREFTGSASARRLYWARSMLGWPQFIRARPNRGHEALAELERAGRMAALITQNVDRLHQAAGSRAVLELHGSIEAVHCLDCRREENRWALQKRLGKLNPDWQRQVAHLAPDGDVILDKDVPDTFRSPACLHCGGTLKPSIVFFGENLPRATTREAWELWNGADALLVAGSSLQVWSGYQFVRKSAEAGMPVVILNLGPTRGDGEAAVKIHARTGRGLPDLVDKLV